MASKISIYKRSQGIFLVIFALFFSLSLNLNASEPVEHSTSETHAVISEEHGEHKAHDPNAPIDISKVAFEHILDSHSWHLWGDGHDALSIPLPVILKTDKGIVTFLSSEFHHDLTGTVVVEKDGQRFVNYEDGIYYATDMPNENGSFVAIGADKALTNAAPLDFSITKNVVQLFLTAILIFLIFTSIARSYKKHGITSAPKGKQSFLEPLIVFVRDDIAKENIGARSDKYVPYLLTVFFLVLFNNFIGLIPISANLTGNIAFTLVLSVFTLIITNVGASGSYWKHIFLPKPYFLWFILMPIELVGVFSKPFALMIRLFANIAGGHIVVISLVGLIFIFKSYAIAPVSIAFTLFIDILECLVALLQAYIFTMLTALFIGSAMEDHSHDSEGAHGEHATGH
ncbi:MAG: F0F1 ATP synthase subunit A [Bacteroidetes bacterium]|nr:F0F1 ATP synthase subunit A [Bacteroidota bacterium]